ncbi:hypothetical protein DFJ74DRAFT_658923 [Hyaloraphidium curvatum]|nr:hypothetical protein DFJ74DRAFT_658923 [Hyaloraphidium curvatum]
MSDSDAPAERPYLAFGGLTTSTPDELQRRRDRDRGRQRSRTIRKQLAGQIPPPPPFPQTTLSKTNQLNTPFVTLIGSAILAHPLRHAPVAFVTEWLKHACPERWGDHVPTRKPNWKSAVSSVLSQYDCFEKVEVTVVEAMDRRTNYWTIKEAHLPCFHPPPHNRDPYPIMQYTIKDPTGPLVHKELPSDRITLRGTYISDDNTEEELFDISDAARAILVSIGGAAYYINPLDEEGSPEPSEYGDEGPDTPGAMFAEQAGFPPGTQFPMVPPNGIGSPAAFPIYQSSMQAFPPGMQHGMGPGGSPFPPNAYQPFLGAAQVPWEPIPVEPVPAARATLTFHAPPLYPPRNPSAPPSKRPEDWLRILRDNGYPDMEPPEEPYTVPIEEYRVDIAEWPAR